MTKSEKYAKTVLFNLRARSKQRREYLIFIILYGVISFFYLYVIVNLGIKLEKDWSNPEDSIYHELVFFGPATTMIMRGFIAIINPTRTSYDGKPISTPVLRTISHVICYLPATYWLYGVFGVSLFWSIVLSPLSVFAFGLFLSLYSMPAAGISCCAGTSGCLSPAQIHQVKTTMTTVGVNPKYMTCVPGSDLMKMSPSDWYQVKISMKIAGINIGK